MGGLGTEFKMRVSFKRVWMVWVKAASAFTFRLFSSYEYTHMRWDSARTNANERQVHVEATRDHLS